MKIPVLKNKCRRCHYNADQRAEILSEHRASGESVADYCNRISLSRSAFYRWRRESFSGVEQGGPTANTSWRQLALPESSGKVEIHFPNAIRVTVHGFLLKSLQ